jgi:hypothetical protein
MGDAIRQREVQRLSTKMSMTFMKLTLADLCVPRYASCRLNCSNQRIAMARMQLGTRVNTSVRGWTQDLRQASDIPLDSADASPQLLLLPHTTVLQAGEASLFLMEC